MKNWRSIDYGRSYKRELDKLQKSKISRKNWSLKLDTINEFKKSLRYILRFIGKDDLAAKIKMKVPKDNELTRDDLLSSALKFLCSCPLLRLKHLIMMISFPLYCIRCDTI
jgi:hypothetical protein